MQLPLQNAKCRFFACHLNAWVLAGLFLLNIGMYLAARSWEQRAASGQFEKECAHVEHAVREAFEHSRSQLITLGSFWEIHTQPSASEFRTLTHRVLEESPYLLGIAWATRLDSKSLARWEQQASHELGFPIQTKDTNSNLVSLDRDEFYPLRLAEPLTRNQHAIGYDLATNPPRIAAIRLAARLNKPVITEPVRFMPGTSSGHGMILITPLPGAPAGQSFLLAAIRPELLLRAALQSEASRGLTVFLRDRDSGENAGRHSTSQQPPTTLRYVRSWRFAEREWQIDIQAHKDFAFVRKSWLPEIGFIAGLALLIVMAAQITGANRAIREARRKARRRNHKLRKLNTELRAEVVERREAEVRLATYSEQLEQATLLAESSAQAKSNFLAMVSHEIRTPMHAIIGMTNILLDSPLNPDQRESAGIVLRSADSLLQIINDILDFSKIEAGKFEVEAVPFDLQQTLSEVMDAVSVRASEKGISLMVGYPVDAPVRFLGDGGAMRQILLNLAGNAVKFTDRGQIAIDVLVLEEDNVTARMYISVSDTGVGIPEDRLHRLFHPFQQADSSMRRKYGGTGLGLAISKRLTELMGGVITVDSQLGAGTIFQLDLPLKKDHSNSPGGYCPMDLHKVAVLVAEPNTAIATILTKQLDGCHIPNLAVGSMPELHDVLQSKESDYRIFLIGGEESDAWDPTEVTAAVHQNGPANPLLVRIAPYATAGERAAMEEAGFAVYLVMPVFAGVLINALGQAWAASRMGQVPKPILTRQSLREEAKAPATESFAALCRVLLVEDNAVNQKIGKRLLDKLNCSVDIAPNGLAAIRQWSPGKYDVVLMDCQMPEMDGFEATAEIRRREAALSSPPTPIIAMTANNMQGDRERCIENGMNDFLPKPVSFAELRQKLENIALRRATPIPTLQPTPRPADEKSAPAIF